MKKLLYSALMLSCVGAWVACDDDRDDNPTLSDNANVEFVLNTPAYASSLVDLASSNSVNLYCSQPEWGFPTAVNYVTQVSLNGEYKVSNETADADESGETKADYYALDPITSASLAILPEDLAIALTYLNGWEGDEDVPASEKIYVRIVATPSTNSSNGPSAQSAAKYSVTSNVVTLNVAPYYVELAPAPIELWYLVGANIGSASWSNGADQIGNGLVPLEPVQNAEYDKKTGRGEIALTAYFDDEFKLINVPGNWEIQWAQGDAFGSFKKNDGGAGNIAVPSAGYYKVLLNTATDVLEISKAEDVKELGEISIAGSFNDWGDQPMTPVFSLTDDQKAHNHLWKYEFQATEDVELKFKTTGSWDTNWGTESFPTGWGVGGGANIKVPAGKYLIIFDDITGYYTFITQE